MERPGGARGLPRRRRPRGLSRAAPQLNVLQLAFPVQIAIGLAALIASLPLIATVLQNWTDGYDAMLGAVLGALGGGGG